MTYKRISVTIAVPEPMYLALSRDSDRTGEHLSMSAIRAIARGYGMDPAPLLAGARKRRPTAVSPVAVEQNITSDLPWPTSLYDLEKHPHRSRSDYALLRGKNGNWLVEGTIVPLTDLERARVQELAEVYAF